MHWYPWQNSEGKKIPEGKKKCPVFKKYRRSQMKPQ